jgi:hypothetical protein
LEYEIQTFDILKVGMYINKFPDEINPQSSINFGFRYLYRTKDNDILIDSNEDVLVSSDSTEEYNSFDIYKSRVWELGKIRNGLEIKFDIELLKNQDQDINDLKDVLIDCYYGISHITKEKAVPIY